MADVTETTDVETTEVETDEARQGVLDTFSAALGEAVVGSHIQPGRGLWVRVERDAWTAAAEVAKVRLGFTFFDYLSAIDWMPSPWGRYEDSAVDVGITPFAPGQPGLDDGVGVERGDAHVDRAVLVAAPR